jgi:WD40 repeat protein
MTWRSAQTGGYWPAPEVWLWDPATGQPVRRPTGGTTAENSVTFSPDGRLLASAGPYGVTVHALS